MVGFGFDSRRRIILEVESGHFFICPNFLSFRKINYHNSYIRIYLENNVSLGYSINNLFNQSLYLGYYNSPIG